MTTLPPLYSPSGLPQPFIRNSHNIARCHHIRSNGVQCGSPSLRGERLCYFHSRIRRPSSPDRLPILEDGNSVQCALIQVVRGILDKSIDRQTAGLLLYALQTAHANLSKVNFQPLAWDVVRDLSGAVPHMEDEPVEELQSDAVVEEEECVIEAADTETEAITGELTSPVTTEAETPMVAPDASPSGSPAETAVAITTADTLRTAIHLARAYVLGEAPTLPKPRKKRPRREKQNPGPPTAIEGLGSG